MSRALIGWIAAAVVAVGGAAFVYLFFLAGGSGEPSTELTTPEVTATTISEVGTTSGGGSDTTTSQPASEVSFVIDSGQTVASFEIGEVLRGEPTPVVGTTDQVAGQVVVDTDDLGAAQFSDIVINARTLQTDSDRRDRAIRGPVILDSGSDEHELITFSPHSVEGLEGVHAVAGETYEFSLSGELTVKGTTKAVIFVATIEMIDESTFEGSAVAEVLRSEFGIGIPSVPSVADVTDEVTLSLEFVATAA